MDGYSERLSGEYKDATIQETKECVKDRKERKRIVGGRRGNVLQGVDQDDSE